MGHSEKHLPAQPVNPDVLAEHKLLAAGVEFKDLIVDAYGTIDADDMEVCDMTLSGSKTSLYGLLSVADLESLTRIVERNYTAQAIERRKAGVRAELFLDRIAAKAFGLRPVF